MSKHIILLFIFISSSFCWGQKIITVVDSQNDAVPFINASENKTKIIGDIQGRIDLSIFSETITLSSFGYQDTTIFLKNITSDTLVIKNDFESLSSVTIQPGINPALRIINNANRNRKINAPNSNLAYQAESYSKFIFSLDSLFNLNDVNIQNDSLFRRLNKNTAPSNEKQKTNQQPKSNQDSILNSFLEKSHLMIMENASTRSFIPPYNEKEIIHAYRISGMNIPALANFANSIQSFSFYDNTFEILGSSYLNPIATGATRKYAYIMDEPVINDLNDTTFIIRFFPKKDKKFDALFGTLYINSKNWEIEKVIAHPIPSKDKMFFIKIIQEYELIDNKKWFPKNLITEFYTPLLELNGKTLNGKGYTHLSEINLNPEIGKIKNKSIILETTADAGKTNKIAWDTIRNQSLTEKEENTYVVIDSIGKEVKLERKVKLLTSLMQGKIPIKYVNLDLTKVIDYNIYEGYRLGLGLETSDLVSEIVTLGGYFAYGTSDRLWKYGGNLDFRLHKRNNVHLQLAYHQDLIDRGMMHFKSQPYQFALNTYYADFYTKDKDKQQDISLQIYGKVHPNLQIGISGAFEDIHFSDDYAFIFPTPTFIRKLQQINISGEILWTPGAKWSLIDNQYFKVKNHFPEIRLKASKIFSNFPYWRFKLDIYQQHKIYQIGEINWLISATKTIGDVPLYAKNTVNATGGNFNLSVSNSFETMLPGTYYMDQYLAVFLRYTTNSWNTRIKFIQPSISLHHAMGIGNMKSTVNHTNEYTFRNMNHGYFETGLIINQLIYINNMGFGIGAFYHYGPDSYSQFKKNLTYKISVVFNIK